MSRLTPELIEQILALPREDRVYLAQQLLESLLPYPEGVSSVSPGLRRGTRRYPGSLPVESYPNGVSSCWCFPGAQKDMQPRWGSPLIPLTQGRRCANPGLEAATPLGLEARTPKHVMISVSTRRSLARRDRMNVAGAFKRFQTPENAEIAPPSPSDRMTTNHTRHGGRGYQEKADV